MSDLTRPDTDLLDLLKRDSEKAISLIFRAHYAFLCQAIIRVVHDAHVAEDLAQDVFHDLWKRKDSLEISTSIRAYLRRSGINKTLNYIRDKKLKWDDEEQLPFIAAKTPSASDYLESQDTEKALEVAIDGLPERCRLVFTLSRFEEMSYREIAEQLNISVKTVENQMTKALKVLREAIEQADKND